MAISPDYPPRVFLLKSAAYTGHKFQQAYGYPLGTVSRSKFMNLNLVMHLSLKAKIKKSSLFCTNLLVNLFVLCGSK